MLKVIHKDALWWVVGDVAIDAREVRAIEVVSLAAQPVLSVAFSGIAEARSFRFSSQDQLNEVLEQVGLRYDGPEESHGSDTTN